MQAAKQTLKKKEKIFFSNLKKYNENWKKKSKEKRN